MKLSYPFFLGYEGRSYTRCGSCDACKTTSVNSWHPPAFENRCFLRRWDPRFILIGGVLYRKGGR